MKLPVLSKCGYRCDLCLAYQDNVQRKDERKKLSDGWYSIYGFRIEPENIICDGCASGDSPRLIDKNCPVRPCVVSRRIDNCASCIDFSCEKLEQRIVDKNVFEEKIGRKLSSDEYECFVKPYESRERLKRMKKEQNSSK